MKILFMIFYLVAIFLIYVFIENHLLVTKRYKISHGGRSRLNVVQISDVHRKTYPAEWSALIKRVKALSPDVILITGDLVSRTTVKFGKTEILLRRLCRICRVYCSIGNHELDLPQEVMERYREMVKRSGAVLLENSHVEFEKDGRIIDIYGADLKSTAYRNDRGGFSGLEKVTADELTQSIGERTENFTILMAHNPFFADEYAKWGADVIFSGHVHGGAVRLPFVGGVLSPERRFFPKYSKGVYTINDSVMVVSAGIGKLRVFNPPEIVFAEIEF